MRKFHRAGRCVLISQAYFLQSKTIIFHRVELVCLANCLTSAASSPRPGTFSTLLRSRHYCTCNLVPSIPFSSVPPSIHSFSRSFPSSTLISRRLCHRIIFFFVLFCFSFLFYIVAGRIDFLPPTFENAAFLGSGAILFIRPRDYLRPISKTSEREKRALSMPPPP